MFDKSGFLGHNWDMSQLNKLVSRLCSISTLLKTFVTVFISSPFSG